MNDPNLHYDHFLPHKLPLPERIRSFAERLLTFRLLEPGYDPLYRMLYKIPTHGEEMWRAYDPSTEDWKIFLQSVENIGGWTVEHTGRSPIVINLTDMQELRRRGKYDSVREVFVRNGFVWCELESGYYAPVSRFEFHPNEESHRWYAEALFQTIVSRDLL